MEAEALGENCVSPRSEAEAASWPLFVRKQQKMRGSI